jgi:hypothetical protein
MLRLFPIDAICASSNGSFWPVRPSVFTPGGLRAIRSFHGARLGDGLRLSPNPLDCDTKLERNEASIRLLLRIIAPV